MLAAGRPPPPDNLLAAGSCQQIGACPAAAEIKSFGIHAVLIIAEKPAGTDCTCGIGGGRDVVLQAVGSVVAALARVSVRCPLPEVPCDLKYSQLILLLE